MKRKIRLTESQLRKVVTESVERILNESDIDDDFNEDDIYEKIDEIENELHSLNEDDAFEYIMGSKNSGLEVELPCGIHFGMGLYAWADAAKEYLPQNMIRPLKLNTLFVSLESPRILKTYIHNAFMKNGTLFAY